MPPTPAQQLLSRYLFQALPTLFPPLVRLVGEYAVNYVYVIEDHGAIPVTASPHRHEDP